ncbi:unnamed protein product [Lathyrus sativus]|nr:unnamed protein product [Lathyrus sativus]
MYLRSLKAYCRCAASFATRSNSSFASLFGVVGVYFGLEMLQDVATTKFFADYAEVFSPDEER